MPSSTEKLLKLLLRRQSLSRADLAKTLHLSRPAISSLVEGLLKQGILLETGCGASNGGKPPIMLELSPRRFGAIGIDIGHERLLRGVLCDSSGTMVAQAECEHDNQFETLLRQSAALIETLERGAGLAIAGIGVAVAGQVDYDTNEVVYCPNFPLKGRGFAELLQEQAMLPVLLDNRARRAAAWEYFFGAARQAEDFLFLSAERGIGTAIYLNGKLFTGRTGVAGEIRDLLVPSPDGTGTLPVEEAMSERFLATLPESRNYLLSTVRYVITLLTNLLDPALIVLGGRFRELGHSFHHELAATLELEPAHDLEFVLSQSGRIGAALGAALHIILGKLPDCQFTKP